MIRILIVSVFSFLGVLSTASEPGVIRLSEPVFVSDDAEIFGGALDPAARPIVLKTLLDSPESFTDVSLRVDTRVSQVCQKKGCFYIATDGERSVRVSFKDYGFFLPTNIGGKTVTMTGVLVERELSEDEAEHFRDDAGVDDIRAGTVYELIADAVSVPLR